MAATAAATRLTEAHRLAQARLGAQTVSRLDLAWPVLNPGDLDRTFPNWLEAVRPIIYAQHDASARLAANYLTTFRLLELGADVEPIVPSLAPLPAAEQVATSMLVTGPVSIRSNLGRGALFDQAVQTARANTARAGMRHALNGGRDTISRTIDADDEALGWARATSGNACFFCRMLASRGPAYKSEGTARFQPHDGCHCQPEPAYHADADWPPGSAEDRELWEQTTAGLSGDKAIAAFRAAVETPA